MQRFRKLALLGAAKAVAKGTANVAAKATGVGARTTWRTAQRVSSGENLMPKSRAIGLVGLGGVTTVGGVRTVRENARAARASSEAPWKAQ